MNPGLRCLGARDSNHDALAIQIASESNRQRFETYLKSEERVRHSQRIEQVLASRFESCDLNRCKPMAIGIAANCERRFETFKIREEDSTVCILGALQRQVNLQGVFVKIADLISNLKVFLWNS